MSKIQWTTETLNPIVGCTKISTGCANCYAVPMSYRLEKMADGLQKQGMNPGRLNAYQGLTNQGKNWTGEIRFVPEALEIPLSIKSPTTYFVNSMSDLFHEDVPDEWIDQVFAMMALCPHHQFQILTKRPHRMQKYFEDAPERTVKIIEAMGGFLERYQRKELRSYFRDKDDFFPFPNVWLGTSIENRQVAYPRLRALLDVVVYLRFHSFLSCEPLLTPLNFHEINYDFRENTDSNDWWIDGFAMQSDFEFKQAGSYPFYQGKKLRLKAKKGDDLSELPRLVHIRELPEVLTPKET